MKLTFYHLLCGDYYKNTITCSFANDIRSKLVLFLYISLAADKRKGEQKTIFGIEPKKCTIIFEDKRQNLLEQE